MQTMSTATTTAQDQIEKLIKEGTAKQQDILHQQTKAFTSAQDRIETLVAQGKERQQEILQQQVKPLNP